VAHKYELTPNFFDLQPLKVVPDWHCGYNVLSASREERQFCIRNGLMNAGQKVTQNEYPTISSIDISGYNLPVQIGKSDVSFVWSRNEFIENSLWTLRAGHEPQKWNEFEKASSFSPFSKISNGIPEIVSINAEVELKCQGREPLKGRAILCLVERGRYVCGRFRLSHKIQERHFSNSVPNISKTEKTIKQPGFHDDFFFQTETISKILAEKLNLNGKTKPSGLLLVSGATNSSKTVLTRGIVLDHLLSLLNSESHSPHIVSFEDPLESWGKSHMTDGEENAFSAMTSPEFGFNFTARERGIDVESLHEARLDAMRQTPDCFIIGEIRTDSDWKHAIELAGTGHLVVATTHAGSISECFSRMFSATNVNNAAERGFVARRVLGVAHIKYGTVEWPGKNPANGDSVTKKEGKFPQLWVRTPQSISSLVAVGLSSLVPNGEFFFSRTHILDSYEEEAQKNGDETDPLCKDSGQNGEPDSQGPNAGHDILAKWIAEAKNILMPDDILNS